MKRRRLLLWMTAGALLCLLAADYRSQRELPAVSVTRVEERTIYYSILADGEVTMPDSVSLYVSQPGTVGAVHVREGEDVEEGQPLFTIQTDSAGLELKEQMVSSLLEAAEAGEIQEEVDLQTALSAFSPEQQGESETGGKVVVTAPRSGTVIHLPEAGDSVLPGISLGKIGDLSSLQVKAQVPEEYAGRVKTGQTVKITGSGLGEDSCKGSVAAVAPYAAKTLSLTGESGKRYVPVTITLTSSPQELRPGGTVEAKIYTDRVKNAIVLPYEAVFQEKKTEYVYKLEGNRAVRQEVETGYELSSRLQITKGLQAGDRVILNPQEIEAGEAVQIHE